MLKSAVVLGTLAAIATLVPLARSRPPANQPPTVSVTITLPNCRDLNVTGAPQRTNDILVEIAIDDPDHDLVSARLLLAPPGFDMEPIVNAPTPFVRRYRWNPEVMAGGREYFIVEAHDNVVPGRLVRARGAVDLPWQGNGATSRWMDVDGDLRPELVTVVRDQPVGSIAGAGAIAVYDRLDADNPHLELDSTAPPFVSMRTTKPIYAIRGGHPHYFHAASPTQDEHLGDVKSTCPLQQADLNGDGILDLVALSAKGSGAIHVWFGGNLSIASRPADATLDPGPLADLFSFAVFLNVRFRDVNGDGFEDVVVNSFVDSSVANGAGAIYVFAGGPTLIGHVGPTATLRLAAPAANDFFGHDIAFGDVTGDGIDDIVTSAIFATWNGITDHGVMAVFAGGPGLVGDVQPLAVFSTTGPKKFGDCEIWLLDVTGDSIADVVVPYQGFALNMGQIYVWNGGATLVGTPAESAVLRDPTAVYHDSDALQVAVVDVTGDGVRDVVDLRPRADVAGIVDAGLGHVWAGGPGLSGTVDPTATFGTTIAGANNLFGSGGGGLRFFDADRDGVLDVIVPSADFAVNGVAQAGALHLWRGGATLNGTPAPDATLTAPSATTKDELSNYGVVSLFPTPFEIVDVTGDGFEDFVVGAYLADVNGVADAGAIHVFDGSSLSGNVVSIATLARATPFASDRLGDDGNQRIQHGFRTVDVTGDGIADVVAIAPKASGKKASDYRGALCVWQGGSGMLGALPPTAELVGESSGDELGSALPALLTGDTDGDGILDLVVAAEHAHDLGAYDVGLAYVVSGGPSLSGSVVPRSRLARFAPSKSDRLFGGFQDWDTYHAGGALLRVIDLDRDGLDDVIGAAPVADDGALADVGMIAWWPNGSDFVPGRGPLEVWPHPELAGENFGE